MTPSEQWASIFQPGRAPAKRAASPDGEDDTAPAGVKGAADGAPKAKKPRAADDGTKAKAAPAAVKLWKGSRQGFPRYVNLFPGDKTRRFECLSTSYHDDGAWAWRL